MMFTGIKSNDDRVSLGVVKIGTIVVWYWLLKKHFKNEFLLNFGFFCFYENVNFVENQSEIQNADVRFYMLV